MTATDPEVDLRARILEALVTAPAAFVRDDPKSATRHRTGPWSRHDRHNYQAGCALCRGEAETLADVVMAVLDQEPATTGPASDAEMAAAHRAWLHAQADKPGGLIEQDPEDGGTE